MNASAVEVSKEVGLKPEQVDWTPAALVAVDSGTSAILAVGAGSRRHWAGARDGAPYFVEGLDEGSSTSLAAGSRASLHALMRAVVTEGTDRAASGGEPRLQRFTSGSAHSATT